MKHLITTLFILTLLTSPFTQQSHAAFPPAPVLATGQTLCYDATGATIACAGTGQDGESQSGLQWPPPRFVDNGDQTQTDKLTGLIWSKNANLAAAKKTWQEALDYVKTLNSNNYLGYNDWRLPNINELGSLANKGQAYSTWLSGQGFTSVQSDPYWSSSSYSHDTSIVLYVYVSDGNVNGSNRSNVFYVWPVRGGQLNTLTIFKTGQTTCYDAVGATITCSGTGQDGELQAGVTWPTPRCGDNGDQTQTAKLTGLSWSKYANPAGAEKTWQQALDYIKTLNSQKYLGYNDWRLPNINELGSLANRVQANSAIWLSGQGFTSVQSNGGYWSSSSYSGSTSYAWYASINGFVNGNRKSSSFYLYVWPVRSGQFWGFGSLILSTSPTFGTVRTDTPPTARQIEIGNRGSSPQSITSITISGTNSAEFSITSGGNNPCGTLNPTLAAGSSCSLMLGFTPTSNGTKIASLDITANGTTSSIALSGTAISTVYGTVTDQATGLGVAGATVTLDTAAPTITTTNTDGSYTFGNLAAGAYGISVSKTGYQTTAKSGLIITAPTSAKSDILLPTVGTLNITSTMLHWASPNVAYSSRVMVAGGTAPYTFTVAYGSLPTGLSLDTTTGTISGTSSGTGSYTFAIGVRDNTATGYSEKEYTIGLVSPLQITTLTLPASQQGSAYSATVAATGGKPAYSFSLINSTVLPIGLTLNTTSGAISGTSRENGTFNIMIRATDSTGITADKSYTLIMATSAALNIDTTTLPQGVIGTAYSTTLAASGGVPARTFSVTGTLPAGLTFSTTTGKLSGTPTAAGLTNLTFTVSDYSYPAQTASVVLPLRIWSSTPVNNTCGSSNNWTFTTAPTTNLCTTGTASTVTGTGPWSWTCTGTSGGTTATCSASIPTVISKPGDCDNSGTVTIAEVQSAINMFLGLKTVEVCVDIDSSGSVSIAEVQKVINSFLGL